MRSFTTVPNLQLVRLPSGVTVRQALRTYRANPDVLYAQPNFIYRTQVIPDDPQFSTMWGLHNTGQAGGVADADIDAPEAWDLTQGSSNVFVVVIDTGVDYNHPDLAANMAQLESNCSDGIDNDGNGFKDDCRGIDAFNGDPDPFDGHSHGTHVSGTIGAVGNNNTGVVGVNWMVKLVACKFLGDDGFGFTSGAIACLDYVAALKDAGLNIVATNNSWGGGGFDQALLNAIDAQRQRGILFIAAAGNAASDNDIAPHFPSNYYLPNVISVAAMNRLDTLAGFSNFGRQTVHLAAPGQEVLSTTPGNTFSFFSGTSMATPHVTGVAALLKAQDSNRDWIAIKNLILAGGVTVASYSQTITGKRLNAHGAMTCAGSTVLSRLQPVADAVLAGQAVQLAMLHINCAVPNGNVQVTVQPGGSTITLFDDGSGADQVAGDGIYSAQYTTAVSDLALDFPDGSSVAVLRPFVEFDFESESNFTAEQFGTVINWNLTSNRGNDSGHSSINSFYFGDPNTSTYNCGTDPEFACYEAGLLLSPPITLGPGANQLAFNYFLESEPGFDFAGVFLFDGAEFFLVLHNFGGGLENFTGQWQQGVADISAFAGQTIQIAFYFDTGEDLFNDFEGWYVDDVMVAATTLGLQAHDSPAQAEGESGLTPFDFEVTLSAPSQDTVTVNFATANGTATAPGDYQAASGMLTFMPGETTKTITVMVVGDTVKEPDETFFVELSGASNALVAIGTAQGVILRDEPNTAPVANAGSDQTVQATSNSGASVQLDGSGSSDNDGDSLTFTWSGPFGQASGQNPTVTVPAGVNTITLVVDDGFGGSGSDTVEVTVTDFVMSADPTSRTISAGQSASFTITATPQFGSFNGQVTLSCGTLPFGTTCSFSPSHTIMLSGVSAASVTLTVATSAPQVGSLGSPAKATPGAPLHALWLSLLGLGGLGLVQFRGRRKNRFASMVLLGMVLGMAAVLTSCGGGGGGGPAPVSVRPGTPAGSHSISINAASGSLQRGVNITVVVQ